MLLGGGEVAAIELAMLALRLGPDRVDSGLGKSSGPRLSSRLCRRHAVGGVGRAKAEYPMLLYFSAACARAEKGDSARAEDSEMDLLRAGCGAGLSLAEGNA